MAHTRHLGFTAANIPRKVTIAHYPKLFETSAPPFYWRGLHVNIPLQACFIFSVQWCGCSQAITAFCHIYDNHQLSYPLRGALKLPGGVV